MCLLSCSVIAQSHSPIKLVLNDWTSQRVLTLAFGSLLQQQNYAVDYAEMHEDMQWAALRTGRIHIQLEVWQNSMQSAFDHYVANGYLLDAGTHKATTREDWWYPEYVTKLCPGLPDWRALNRCAHLFKTPESNGKGLYHTGTWDFGDPALIRGLNLNFVINRVEDDKALFALLSDAVATKKPIVLLNWLPNWMNKHIKGQFVEFPTHSPECEQDPNWGINPDFTHDCGNPKSGWLKKAMWPGLDNYAPCVARLTREISFSKAMLEDAADWVFSQGLTEQQAAQRWLEKYQNQVLLWQKSLQRCKKSSNSSASKSSAY